MHPYPHIVIPPVTQPLPHALHIPLTLIGGLDGCTQVGIEFMDLYSHTIPVYDVEPLEKITDA